MQIASKQEHARLLTGIQDFITRSLTVHHSVDAKKLVSAKAAYSESVRLCT
jgi:hypothetical protein